MMEGDISNQRRGNMTLKRYNALTLVEYEWPADSGELHFLQEHLGRFLNIKAFHRKYEDLIRRVVELDEKKFLLDQGIINDVEIRFRLIALKYNQVINFMKEMHRDKYHLYLITVKCREIEIYQNTSSEYHNQLKNKELPEIYKKALIDSVRYNNSILNEIQSRLFNIDLNTLTLHSGQAQNVKKSYYKITKDLYPIALHPSQFQTTCPIYSDEQLKSIFCDNDEIKIEEVKKKKRGRKSKKKDSNHSKKSKIISNEEEAELVSEIVKNDEICRDCNSSFNPTINDKLNCSECKSSYHYSCMGVNLRLKLRIDNYPWKCFYCKKCCICGSSDNSTELLLCDACDRPYHSSCVELSEVPLGRWVCSECGICSSCLKSKQSKFGYRHQRMVVNGVDRIIQLHCLNCYKNFQSGSYCRVCYEVFWNQLESKNLIKCDKCTFTVHSECSKIGDTTECLVCAGLVDVRF